MSSVVIELQRDALSGTVPVSDLLRKALVVAKKLKISEFEKWVANELNGYEKDEDIPQYRRIRGVAKAWNPVHGWQPIAFPDNEMEEIVSGDVCYQTIAEIESLLKKSPDLDTFEKQFTAEQAQLLRKSINFHTEITLIIPSTSLVKIVDVVKTIILNWSMKLEEEKILGEGLTFTSTERETAEKVSYNINNFYAPVQSPQIQQEATHPVQISSIHQLDVNSLNDFLKAISEKLDELVIASDKRQELDAEIKTLEAQAKSPNPKHSVIKDCLASVRHILEGAGAGVAAQLIAKYGSLLGSG